MSGKGLALKGVGQMRNVLSVGVFYQFVYVVAQLMVLCQVADGQMHTPTPVMTWVRWNVDSFTISIGIP